MLSSRAAASSHTANKPRMLAQQLANGVATGLCYGVLAAGLSLTYSASRVVNFAHGDLFVVSAFVCLTLQKQAGFSYAAAALIAIAGASALSGLIGFAVVDRIRPGIKQSIATIAIALGLRDGILVYFGSDSASFPALYPEGVLTAVGATIPWSTALTAAGFAVVVVGFGLWMEKSRWGIWMRAAAMNPSLASSVGVSVGRMRILAFCLSGGLAAAAAALIGPSWQVNHALGGLIAVKAFAAAVIGGFGDLRGAVLGGLALGLAESMFAGYVSSAWRDLAVYGLLLLVLALKPTGLLSMAARRIA